MRLVVAAAIAVTLFGAGGSQLDKSQAAWIAYRKAECDAVYSWWSEGTIRGAMYQGCWLEVTKSRSAAILATWLQFMDSTPPLMPPPAPK